MKSDAGEVSIIMPAYNVERFIGHAIQSVLDQTYSNWALIIIDDCSTDKTVEVVYSFDDDRIKLIRRQKNKGIAAGRNRGITEAKGEWIAWLDADDAWQKERLTKLLEIADSCPMSFVGSDLMLCFSDNDTQLIPWKRRLAGLMLPDVFITSPADLFHYDFPVFPIIRRSILVENEISFSDEFYGHEWLYFILKLSSLGLKFININEPLYNYRLRSGSDSSTYACIISQLKTLDYLLSADWVESEIKELLRGGIVPTRHRLLTTAVRERKWGRAMGHAMSSPMSILYAIRRMPHVLLRRLRQKRKVI
jgi:succinoglycan biosynthesis protein ExoO